MKNLSPQQQKNWALFAVLMGLVLLLFIMSILRFGAASGVTH